jgi:formiminotetrahydrofolate cyclodeaminase
VAKERVYGQETISDFLGELARVAPPLPAGGCTAALAGALAAALGQFVTQLTIKKANNPDSTDGLTKILSRLIDLRQKCVETMDDDVREYEGVMQALRMPKTTQEEQAKREVALQEAKNAALASPMALIECGLEMLRYSLLLIKEGYQVALADAAVAAELAHACLWGGSWIAKANLLEISDPGIELPPVRTLEARQSEAEELYTECRDLLRKWR